MDEYIWLTSQSTQLIWILVLLDVNLHHADGGGEKTLEKTLEIFKKNLEKVSDSPPTSDSPSDVVMDKGYHSRDVLKNLDSSPWKSRISEPKRNIALIMIPKSRVSFISRVERRHGSNGHFKEVGYWAGIGLQTQNEMDD